MEPGDHVIFFQLESQSKQFGDIVYIELTVVEDSIKPFNRFDMDQEP